jgi:hypothetical protein
MNMADVDFMHQLVSWGCEMFVSLYPELKKSTAAGW